MNNTTKTQSEKILSELKTGDVILYNYYFNYKKMLAENRDLGDIRSKFIGYITNSNEKQVELSDIIKISGKDPMSDAIVLFRDKGYDSSNDDHYEFLEVFGCIDINEYEKNRDETEKDFVAKMLKTHPQYFV